MSKTISKTINNNKNSKTISEHWDDIFAQYNILNEINKKGFYKITADTIKQFKEPRLMAKFDFSSQLPKIFSTNGIGIMPIRNGEYILGKFNMFQKINTSEVEKQNIKKTKIPSFIETIDPDNIYSESNALNVALLSGMLKDVAGEKVVETIQGKMRTNDFSYTIHGNNSKCQIDVNGAAIEIDGGYEGKNIVLLVEAKKKMTEDFVIRQLYYPYRFWKQKVNKTIKPFFFIYDNGIYTFFEYEFEDLMDYNSLKLKKIKRFELETNLNELTRIVKKVKCINELPQGEVPFPQANSFTRIIQIIQLAYDGAVTASDLAEYFQFQERQGKYYIDAARYLNILNNGRKEYTLTNFGRELYNMNFKDRNRKLIEEILKHRPFYYTFIESLELNNELDDNYIINNEEIVSLMKEHSDLVNEETLKRRASTVKEWIRWIRSAQI